MELGPEDGLRKEIAVLSCITLKNFKSYREARLKLGPLTLLIGANASGKSNALEGLRLLSWLAQGQKLSTIQYQVQDSDSVLRGRVEDIGRLGSTRFSLGCYTNHEWNILEVTLQVREGELHVAAESITSEDRAVPLYEIKGPAVPPSTDLRVAYNNFQKGKNKPVIICSDQMAVFPQLDTPAAFDHRNRDSQKIIPAVSKAYQNLLGGILFLDPVPSLMRASEFKTEKKLRGDGRNLSGVLYNLCRYRENKEIILDLIRSLPEQDITDIGFYESDRGKVLVEMTENFGEKKRSWDATLLSDGTLRVLAVAAALLSAPSDSLVVIEEVDNGVHPSRAETLLTAMLNLATRRSLRLLLSTHNPALMDAVPDRALGDVVFCYRDPEEGDSRLVSLADLPEYPALAARAPLGELASSRVIERHAKSGTSAKEKKDKAQTWLDSLEGDEP